MPHSLLYKPSGIVFTYSLYREWQISVDGDSVRVVLAAANGSVLLDERYFAVDARVSLFDVGELVEQYLRVAKNAYGRFSLKLLDEEGEIADSCIFKTFFCDRFSTASDPVKFLEENFLTTLPLRRIAPNAELILAYFAYQGESIAINVDFKYISSSSPGSVCNGSFSNNGRIPASDSVQYVSIKVDDVRQQAAVVTGLVAGDISILAFSVNIGLRSLSCFVDNSLSDQEYFFFYNCFNVAEVAYFPLSSTAKSVVERDLAVINSSSVFYNHAVSKSFEVQSGNLTSDEAMWIEQLFSSRTVSRLVRKPYDDVNPDMLVPVLITESSCEVSDSDEKPASVKFSWRFADNRPFVELPVSSDIFSEPFNIQFS